MDEKPTSAKLHTLRQAHCGTCSLSSLCLPVSLNLTDMDRLDKIIDKSRPLKKGEYLFNQGESFRSLYAIRAGSVKCFSVSNEGDEQITGFYFPGELVGLSGMDTESYPVSARVLETTTVCEIPYERLDDLAGHLPELRRQIMRTMSKEIGNDQQMMLLLSKKNAEQRLATFLMKLSERFRERGYSANCFRLSMSRNEIGNYLGLAVETVSRVLTRFQSQDLIRVEGKEISLVDYDQLFALSGECQDTQRCPNTSL
ncbi:fumarate/nitrate reduction transcriptional regulator Fnr [Nitrincola tapanii]|uniref:Fumarate/nitrate reduction transcriptional regulator Fnr n=1 Tax=Nitrincola tapanii TaxID=1708751 RepID=A0A5A9W6Q7_9GAMM|nr:fumarate/nitrate reduction transcriptional regulator Fnr [Nitrincola tapanii]KAA0875808.1 fumarate/nitrate reduction transcriptional regulator Fnr [Nitrincola tapanii]